MRQRFGADECEPQQPFAKTERTHKRPPTLVQIGGRKGWIGR